METSLKWSWEGQKGVLSCTYFVTVFQSLNHAQLFATPRTVAHQAPLSMGFPRQEYWSDLPFPSPGDLPDPRIKLGSPALQADSLWSEPLGKPHANTPWCLYRSQPEEILEYFASPAEGDTTFLLPSKRKKDFLPAWQQLNQWELILIRLSCWAVCEILVGWPGMEPGSQQWECRLLTTGLCGIPLSVSINRIQLDSHICFCIQSIGLSLSRILWKPTLYTWCHENSSAFGHPLIGSWGLSRGYREYLRNVA